MASGFFPLYKTDPVAIELSVIIKNIKTLRDSGAMPRAWDNDQRDNAAFDGYYEAYIGLAIELLERCIEQ